MSQPSVVHGTFVIERTFEATPARVFAAFSSSEAKSHWFGTDDIEKPSTGLQTDFRIGGRESWSAGEYKYEAAGIREHGTRELFDTLAKYIAAKQRV